jgi:acyl carrier protein
VSELNRRVYRCFQEIFPGLPESQIESASTETVGDWNSMTTINLVLLLEEEFATQLEPEDIEQLRSYPTVLETIRRKVESAAGGC